MSLTHISDSTQSPISNVHNELQKFETEDTWNIVYERLKNEATSLNEECPTSTAREVINRPKNRYRDIIPYDSTRVCLSTSKTGDYINASYVDVASAPSKRYILTQGPMPNTCSHFWLMVWECKPPAIIMLNRILENGIVKCYPYFPHQEGLTSIHFDDVDIIVGLEAEVAEDTYVHRVFNLIHIPSDGQHRVSHFHYTNWPDFGVPGSPGGLLNFLWAVRLSGALSDYGHPSIIHCSAGVGRSGAFVLIDIALHLVEERGSMCGVSLSQLFLELRRCRMGIIQTADQLRFCYIAVAAASDLMLSTPPAEWPYLKFAAPAQELITHPMYDMNSDSEEDGDEEEECDNFDDEVDDQDFEDEVLVDEQVSNYSQLRHRQLGSWSVLPPVTVRDAADIRMTDSGVLLDSPPHGEATMTASVAVGPGSREPTNLCAWSRHLPMGSADAAASTKSRLRIEAPDKPEEPVFLHDMGDSQLFQSNSNRSNNAVPAPISTEPLFLEASHTTISTLSSEAADTGSLASSSSSSSESIAMQVVRPNTGTSSADGDSAQLIHRYSDTEPLNILQSVVVEASPAGAGIDISTAELVSASYERQQRRLARQRRREQMQERIAEIRQQMQVNGLERKRWLPSWLRNHLRRFYTQSGVVCSPVGAVLMTTFIFGGICLMYIGFRISSSSVNVSPEL